MKKLLFTFFLLAALVSLTTAAAFAYVIKGLEEDVDAVDVKIDGKHYVLLTDLCKAHGISWVWDSVSRKVTLRNYGHDIVFLVGSKYYNDGEKTKKLSAPVRMKYGSIWIPVKFAKDTAKKLFISSGETARPEASKPKPAPKREKTEKAAKEKPQKKKFKIKKITIDPGHGGKDPGAISRTGRYEKDIVLDVSARVKKELEKKGITVMMTRDSDKFISLGGRTKAANANDADFFVSIHANANKRRWVNGFEVYYLSTATDDSARAQEVSENSALKYEEDSFGRHTKDLDTILWDLDLDESRIEATDLAGFICQEVDRKVNPDKNSIKSARFYVLKGARMPAVLVELGYLSNKYDEKNLKDSSYRQKMAEGIAAGILAYKNVYESSNGFSN